VTVNAERPARTRQSLRRAATTRVSASSRRRGNALLQAIYAAVLDELVEGGLEGLTIEGVAKRAHTGKAAIYRRWSDKVELVAATFDALLPQVDELPDTGDIRGDLIVVFQLMVDFMNSPSGCALARIFSDTARTDAPCGRGAGASEHDPDGQPTLHSIKEQTVQNRQAMIFDLLRRGVERGEVRPDAVCQRVVETGPALLMARCMLNGGQVSDGEVVAIVDEVLVPLVRAV
jgi:AcrR family transcriptional regulator